MEWTDEGIVLSARKHGETSAIVTLLTRAYAATHGLLRGGAGKGARGILQPGNRVEARWRARLADHLGTLTCEMTHAFAAAVLDDADRLAALSAACAIAEAALPEREPFPPVYDGLLALLQAIEGDVWPVAYVRWELGLLTQLEIRPRSYRNAAATGANDQLAYVSPKSGRAGIEAAGEPYKGRLLALNRRFSPGAATGPAPGPCRRPSPQPDISWSATSSPPWAPPCRRRAAAWRNACDRPWARHELML